MAGRTRWGAVIGAGALMAATIAPGAAVAADPVEIVFTATGAEQQWVVPDGVTSIEVVAIGGPAGSGYRSEIHVPSPGGNGARVEGQLAVTPGATLYVEVGGAGGNGFPWTGGAGGFNGGAAGGLTLSAGGGGGGGASDLRTLSRTQAGTLASRLFVAAGGGGGGGGGVEPIDREPNQGGHAGAPGMTGGGGGGGAGGVSAGGAGGFGGDPNGLSGAAGVLGGGGVGGDGSASGGGGGGGAYGGGGGGGGLSAGGGGGGGGSSSTGALTDATISADSERVASITIAYGGDGGGGNDAGVVDAVLTVPSSAACLELSTTSIDFGTAPLGSLNVAATPNVQVTNCSSLEGSLFARGSDATGTGAAWTLDDTGDLCDGSPTLALDRYHLYVNDTSLSGENKGVATLDPGADASLNHFIDTACPGSTGAGTTMSLQVTYLITE